MFKYLDNSDSSHLQCDDVYKTIMRKLNDFIDYLPSSKDKELLLKMVNEVYYKRYKSIGDKSESDTEVMLSMIMALLIEQKKEIKKLNGREPRH